MDPETPYLLPDGERVWVHPTTEASKQLGADEDGFEHAYDAAREALADPRPSIPLEEAAAQIGWDLDEFLGDADLPTSQPPRS